MILLSLDASTTAVGWARFGDGDYHSSGAFYLEPWDPWWERVQLVQVWLDERLAREYVDVLGYELATGRHGNVHTDRVLGAVEYVVRITAKRHKTQFVEVTASQVRASDCHKEALPVAREIAGRDLAPGVLAGDEADAIGVALAVLGKMKKAGWLEQ